MSPNKFDKKWISLIKNKIFLNNFKNNTWNILWCIVNEQKNWPSPPLGHQSKIRKCFFTVKIYKSPIGCPLFINRYTPLYQGHQGCPFTPTPGRMPSYFPLLETSGSHPHFPNSIPRVICFSLLWTDRVEVEKVKSNYQKFIKNIWLKSNFKMTFRTKLYDSSWLATIVLSIV